MNYKLTHKDNLITAKFKNVVLKIHNANEDVKIYVETISKLNPQFKDFYRAIQINEKLTVETIR